MRSFKRELCLSWILLAAFSNSLFLRAETYVNQRVTANPDGTFTTNWLECVIEGNVVWKAAQGPYIVDHYDLGITVKTNATLTVESGAVLEFVSSRDWSGLQVFGTLNATGGVIFRRSSVNTNGNWSGIRFYTNSVGNLDQVLIEDAGHVTEGWQVGHPGAALYIEDSSPAIRNVTIRRSGLHGIRLTRAAGPVLENNRIEQCPGHAIVWTDLQGTPSFNNNSGTSNNFNAIYIGNGTLGRDWAMLPNQIPYVLQGWDGNLVIASNATLTVQAGTIVKCSYGRDGGAIDVYGNLVCRGGASPIILTSMEDDEVLGATDNSTNAVYQGAWSGIRFEPGSHGLIENTEIRYSGHVTMGWQAPHPGAAIYIDSADPIIRHVLVTGAGGNGIKLAGSAQARLEDNEIDNSGDYAVLSSAFAGNPVLTNNHGTNNAHDGIFLPNGILTADTTWYPNPGLPYVTAGWDGFLVVNTNVSLTALPGVLVKNGYGRDGGALVVYGQLVSQGTLAQPVIFTSMEDDTQGDTDRTTNAVYAGAWSGIRLYSPGRATVSYTQLRYSGHVTSGWQAWHPGAAVFVSGTCAASFDHVRIDHGQDLAVRLSGDGLTLSSSTLSSTPRGVLIEIGGANSQVNYSQFLGITDYAVLNSNSSIEFDARDNWWGDVNGPSGAGPGLGAKVSDHVRFDPYSGGTAARLYSGMRQVLQPPPGLHPPFQIVSGDLPSGLQFDPNTGTLSGASSSLGSALIGVASTAAGGVGLPFYYVLDVRTFLQSPPDQAPDWPIHPILSWEATSGAAYHLQVAADSGFSRVLLDAPGLTNTSKEIGPLKPGTPYYWRVSSSALGTDWSPTSSFQTWSGGPLSGYGLSFDGVDDQLNLGALPNLSALPQWSVTAWVNPAAFNNVSWPTIFSYGYWGASLGLNSATGALESWFNNGEQLIAFKLVPTNQWSFVALVSDGTNRILYVNAEEVGRGPGGAPVSANSAAIGAEPGGKASSHFAGVIDEIAIWRTALDASTLQRMLTRRTWSRDSALLQGFHLDEGAGTMVYDCATAQAAVAMVSNPVWVRSDAGIAWVDLPEVTVLALRDRQLNLAWGINGEGFVLEESSNMGPDAVWHSLTSNPSSAGLGLSLGVDVTGPSRFYRLRER
jgi:hypothetical protein